MLTTQAIDWSIDITATSAKVVPENSRRIALFITNDSDTVAYINLGSSAVSNKGIRLNASGGSFEINNTNLFTGEIHAIGGATKRLGIIEVILVETD